MSTSDIPRISTSPESRPWDFRPAAPSTVWKGTLKSIGLALVAMFAILFAMGALVAALEPTTQTKSVDRIVFPLIALTALAIGGVAIAALVKSRGQNSVWLEMAKCPPGTVSFLGGSSLRKFTGNGNVRFEGDAMILTGMLGPNLLLPLVLIVVGDLALLAMTQKGAGILGIFICLYAYDKYKTAPERLPVADGSISKIECLGPRLKMTFCPHPAPGLSTVTMVVPPDQSEFYRQFDRHFPGLLPPDYMEAVRRMPPPVVPPPTS